ncbi:MAG: hypothetical protein AAGG01_08180 [Planctomycetota bacterium]
MIKEVIPGALFIGAVLMTEVSVCGLAFGATAAGGSSSHASASSALGDLLGDLQRELRRADRPDTRANLLEKIAAAPEAETAPHAVALALAKGLKDESLLVKAKAAELLGLMRSSDEALDGLARAAKDIKKERKAAVDLSELDLPTTSGNDTVQKLNDALARLKAMEANLKEFQAYQSALTDALLARRDDRCVEPLGHILELEALGSDGTKIVTGLFHIGTAPAIGVVVDQFSRFEDRLKELGKKRDKAARQRPERVPRYWQGTKDTWKSREESRILGVVKKLEADGVRLTEQVEKLAQFVGKQIEATELAPAPRGSSAKAWKRWWRTERAKLPASLEE